MTPATLVPNAAYRQPFWVMPDRRITMASAAALGVLFVAILTATLNPDGRAAQLILDRRSPHFPYPFTIQNFEHVFFFIALGELFVRWRVGARELSFSDMGLLPEDPHTVLQAQDLSACATAWPINSTANTDFCLRWSTCASSNSRADGRWIKP
jgi:hypothetical protein